MLTYRSKDGNHYFAFECYQNGSNIEVYCVQHPGFNGQDSSASKTHLFSDGRLCFVSGRAPTNMDRACVLIAQWAEYFIEYRKNGISQS